MSFDTITHVLSADLAAGGTVALGYPTNRDAGAYLGGIGHELFANGAKHSAPADFTLSFGASSITLTYGSGKTTIPAQSTIRVNLQRVGDDDFDPTLPNNVYRAAASSVYVINLGSPDVADPNGVAESQSVGEGEAFELDGALVVGGEAVFDQPRNVVAAWTTTSVLTITGKDEYGNTVVETSASGAAHTGKKAFKRITSVTSSVAITSATVGTGDVLGLPVYIANEAQVLGEMLDGALLPREAGISRMDTMLKSLGGSATVYTAAPVAGSLTRIDTVMQDSIAGADITIKPVVAGATQADLILSMSGSGGGVMDSLTMASATVTALGVVNLAVSGGSSTDPTDVLFALTYEPDNLFNGTIVAGVTTTPTATTGDVRGTYDPALACDGATNFQLLVSLPDVTAPRVYGVSQYAG